MRLAGPRRRDARSRRASRDDRSLLLGAGVGSGLPRASNPRRAVTDLVRLGDVPAAALPVTISAIRTTRQKTGLL